MFRKIRTTLAVVFWVLITWLLLDFTGAAHTYLGWMARIQFMPAVLALNVGALLFIVALTLLLGRIYCSVICPLGVMQDAIARTAGTEAHRKEGSSTMPEACTEAVAPDRRRVESPRERAFRMFLLRIVLQN